MASNDLFRIHGADEVAKALDNLSRGTQNTIVRPGLRQGAAEIRKIAKKLVRIDDGHLKKAIQSKVITQKGRNKGVVAKIGILKNTFTDENGVPVQKYAQGIFKTDKTLENALKQGEAAAVKKLVNVTIEKLAAFERKLAEKTRAKK